jgi:hypothetical protein
METLGDKKVAKSSNKEYGCEICNYTCCKKYNLEKHLTTAKHIKITKEDNLVAKSSHQLLFTCEFCNKKYKHRQGLWKHKKQCYIDEHTKPNKLTIEDKDELIILA